MPSYMKMCLQQPCYSKSNFVSKNKLAHLLDYQGKSNFSKYLHFRSYHTSTRMQLLECSYAP